MQEQNQIGKAILKLNLKFNTYFGFSVLLALAALLLRRQLESHSWGAVAIAGAVSVALGLTITAYRQMRADKVQIACFISSYFELRDAGLEHDDACRRAALNSAKDEGQKARLEQMLAG
jgi:hypothetical protein